MKKLAIVGALMASVSPLALLLSSPANAADLAIKAPPRPAAAPPAYSWTGCYVGAQVGWGWGRNSYSESSFSFGNHLRRTGSSSVNTSGGLFGGQVGCNYQFASNWVLGVQGDAAGTDINGKGLDPLGLQKRFPGPDGTIVSVKTDWLASATARLGTTVWNNQALFYVKGGAAWTHDKWDLSAAHQNFGSASLPEENRSGWTFGAGVEWMLSPSWPNWSAFVEYNYYDFNHGSTYSNSGTSGQTCAISNNVGADPHCTFTTGRQTINTVKVGVNYKFNGPW